MFEHFAITIGTDAYAPTKLHIYSSMPELLRLNDCETLDELNKTLEIPDDAWENDTITKYPVKRLHVITSSAELSLETLQQYCFATNVIAENIFIN